MKHTQCNLAILIVYCSLVLSISSCTFMQSDAEGNARPACVTIDSYSDVIEQVMKVQPDWEALEHRKGGFQYRWTIEDEGGKHALSAFLTAEGCVCATVAASQFRMGGGKEELVGMLEGAAAAPASDLNYTTWLESKITFSCGISNILRKSYEVEKLMEDGTTWKLTCSRKTGGETFNMLYTLKIATPGCMEVIEAGDP
jgi:hypothetical protein